MCLLWTLSDPARAKGPVIRINPDEVHINDPDYFDEVYNQTNGRAQKPLQIAEAFGPYPAVNSKSRCVSVRLLTNGG
jgi:cytochrome P450